MHEETAALLRLVRERQAPDLSAIPLEQARFVSKQSVAAASIESDVDMVWTATEIAAPHGSVPARIYRPAILRTSDVVLFFHGGGWTLCDVETHHGLASAISAGLGARLISVDYRLAPEHVFPAAFMDASVAADWLAASPAALGEPVSGAVLAGDSAGGNLAAALSAQWRGPIALRAQLLFYPVLDVSRETGSYEDFGSGFGLDARVMRWFASNYVPEPDARSDIRVSPLLGDVADLPPSIIVAAGLDILRDEARAYAARLAGAGIETFYLEAVGFPHGWAGMPRFLPSAQDYLQRALGALTPLLAALPEGRDAPDVRVAQAVQ
jgi:acetyl esterase